ncbi:MAG: hypothetical protein BGO98_42065 [Myxococcales bacterium 68-20]|nr:UPF0149 family protein [Myxococcales bacterium]OJY27841.1 MAG: hypothetical protein BGO98_42065 [Myxococcales bacterium 68-20]
MANESMPNTKPLTDEERAILAGLLGDDPPFDPDAIDGLLTAVAVAPGLVPPSVWLPRVLPGGAPQPGAAGGSELLGLVMREYDAVVAGVQSGTLVKPDSEEHDRCVQFARGYIAGAQLDPEWNGNEARWGFVSWAALLAGRPELVPADVRAQLAGTEPALASSIEMFVLAARDSFVEGRGRAPAPTVVRGDKVGRNDPCPCGSGKKFKRCCVDKQA